MAFGDILRGIRFALNSGFGRGFFVFVHDGI